MDGASGVAVNGQQAVSHRERVAHWQTQQRELLQCLLQQQVAHLSRFSTPADWSQVWLCM